ncbi:MAG: alpha/beta hydrolase [Rikenellaceae bacterium]
MRREILSLVTLLITTSASAQYQPDILGEGFEQCTLSLEPDYSGEICATLIRRAPLVDSSRAVLYIHGYNDYFFQREMAERFTDSLYNFYALDLRKYGRSHREGQNLFEVREMSEYFEDIDSAISQMRSEGMEQIILMAHSTGGLTTSLYCNANRNNPKVDAMILNSPFLDMNLGGFTENILLPIVSMIGKFFPDLVVFCDPTSAYYESLDRDHKGEWKYDTTLKLKSMNPTTAGWLRAIHRGQKELQRGLNIDQPILLMYSDKSTKSPVWTPEYQCSDAVLDVKDIAYYGERLGSDITHAQIEDGMHDLILSGYEARESVYNTIFEWLKKRGL